MINLLNNEEMYTIGVVSKKCNIPIRTLRYYDEIGLVKPEKVDNVNNYRYYSKEQILSINIIKDFKKLGFSLQEIKLLLRREDISLLLTKLETKLYETNQKIEEYKYLQSKIKAYINMLDKGKNLLDNLNSEIKIKQKYNIEIKKIPSCTVIYTRYRCPCNPAAFIERYSQLLSLLEKYHLHRIGALKAIFHDYYTNFNRDDADIEVCIPIVENKEIPSITRKFGGFLSVTTLHNGNYKDMIEAYKALMNWIDDNNYKLNGSAIEKYIIDSGSTVYEENYVTEIILPIKKK